MLARHGILHELGRGAMGAVYAARDRTTGAVVALKRLDPSFSQSDAGLAGRFLKHARSARHLSHPNIVRIHDAGEAAGTAYVVMELLEGESLRAILDAGPLPVARAIRIAHEIASGLAYAHLEGVMHGGLTPSNIIVRRSGPVKITDFGIGQAALLSGARGAAGYASPEQLRGEPVDHRSDIFSLGVLFYEMLTGRRPPEGEPAPPSELNPLVPRALDPIVLGMLAAQPAARMPGVPVLLRELERLEGGLGLEPGASTRSDEPAASVPPPAAGPFEQPDRIPDRDMFDYRRAMRQRETWPERPSRSGAAIFAGLALVIAVLGIGLSEFLGLTAFMDDWSRRSERAMAASRAREAPATAPEPPLPAAPPPVAKAPGEPVTAPPDPMPPKPPAARPGPPAQAEVARAPEQPASPPAAPAPQPPRAAQPAARVAEQPPAKVATQPATKVATQPAAKVATQQPGGTARLIVAVSPRGELYIDGNYHGTTPPITSLELEPGMHRIEVRSGSRKPYLTYMTVEPGDVRRIRHDFNAKPIRPPG